MAQSVFPRARTALLLVDVINLFDFPGGASFARRAIRPARNIARLRARAHRGGVPVAYVNDNFGRWRSDFNTLVAACRAPGKPGVAISSCSGFAADNCVLFTAAEAHMRDYTVVVPSDCCGSEQDKERRHALGKMRKFFHANTAASPHIRLRR